jgi:ABC-type cobalamin transport system ATPase subunit
MAGSFNHILNSDGEFTMDFIENIGDAHEALEECYKLIVELSNGEWSRVSLACRKLKLVDPF